MKSLLILCLFSLVIVSSQKPPANVKVYVESLCSDTARFASTQFKTLIENPNRAQLLGSFEIIPFGNAIENEGSTVGNRSFTCQHDVNECKGNYIENCAIATLEYADFLTFWICFEEAVFAKKTDFVQITHDCAQPNDYINIMTCYNNQLGEELHHFAGKLTGPHQRKGSDYIPYFFVDGAHNDGVDDLILENFTKFLCDYTENTDKLPGCKNLSTE